MVSEDPSVFLMDAAALPEAAQQASCNWLSETERRRLHAIRSASRQIFFVTARLALRRALMHSIPGSAWQDWRLSWDENRAPAVMNPPHPLYLSLAHSESLIAVSVSRRPVGVDIEVQRKPRPLPGMMELISSPEEGRRVGALSADMQAAEFYRVWTLKEAYFKRAGTGLDWTRIRALTTQEVVGDPACAAVWEGVHQAVPYTLAVCTDTLVKTPALVMLSELEPPASAQLWTYATTLTASGSA